MKTLEEYAQAISLYYEDLVAKCDEAEAAKKWDTEEMGDMELYIENALLCTVIRIIAADGVFNPEEVEFLNKAFYNSGFGFDYSVNELMTTYKNAKDSIDEMFENGLDDDMELLRGVSEEIAELYKNLLINIAELIINSDGKIDAREVAEAENLKALLGA